MLYWILAFIVIMTVIAVTVEAAKGIVRDIKKIIDIFKQF